MNEKEVKLNLKQKIPLFSGMTVIGFGHCEEYNDEAIC